jgi:hypothetical protein
MRELLAYNIYSMYSIYNILGLAIYTFNSTLCGDIAHHINVRHTYLQNSQKS